MNNNYNFFMAYKTKYKQNSTRNDYRNIMGIEISSKQRYIK
jgi:hypothetical protein